MWPFDMYIYDGSPQVSEWSLVILCVLAVTVTVGARNCPLSPFTQVCADAAVSVANVESWSPSHSVEPSDRQNRTHPRLSPCRLKVLLKSVRCPFIS